MTETAANLRPPRAWALHGATGITGGLVLDRALAAGLRPRLVGRDTGRLHALADRHGLERAVAALDAPAALDAALAGQVVLLNVAGPFAHTAAPLVAACLRLGVDYLDLTGELGSLRALLGMAPHAAAAGVALVGGAGFGIAATDRLARLVSDALGGAERLRIAVAAESGFASPAVAASTLAVLAEGGHEVAGGALVRRRLARRRWREITPEGRSIAFASAPLADLVGALHATGVPDIVAGVPMPSVQARIVALIAPLLPRLARVPAIGRRLARTGGHAAAAEPGAGHRSRVWVCGTHGDRAVGLMLEGGEGLGLAADIAVAALRAHLARRPAAGAHTPVTAYGAGWMDALPGVQVIENEAAGRPAPRAPGLRWPSRISPTAPHAPGRASR
jgi:saccharopine dehydrogenase (NAD+, L-lysine-forming)